MNFHPTTYTAPSGRFVSTQGFSVGENYEGLQSVFNPGIIDIYRGSYQKDLAFRYESSEWCAALSKYSCRVSSSDFDDYARVILSLAEHVGNNKVHCALGPLRGAAKPCVTTEVMNRGAVEYSYFDFQAGSQIDSRQRVIQNLKPILLARDPEESIYRINITDTACGGQGINALVGILKEIKAETPSFQHQQWNLDLNLLHAGDANLANIENVRKLSEAGSFDIQLNRYPVPNLIVEDYDPALAVDILSDGKTFSFKPCAKPGKFLYQDGNDVFIVESENCYLTIEEFLSQSVTEEMLTQPRLQQAGNIWSEYQNKA